MSGLDAQLSTESDGQPVMSSEVSAQDAQVSCVRLVQPETFRLDRLESIASERFGSEEQLDTSKLASDGQSEQTIRWSWVQPEALIEVRDWLELSTNLSSCWQPETSNEASDGQFCACSPTSEDPDRSSDVMLDPLQSR